MPELSSHSHRESVSAVLRRAREKHGQDVRTVAQVLRIRQVYLEALESGSYDRLPGNAYALGFLRTYAEYLGLNANNIVDRFKDEVQGPERHTELVFPEPVIEGRIPGGAIILISVVLLSAAYGGWFYMTNQGRTVADLMPALPEQIQTLIDGQSQPAPVGNEPVMRAEAPSDSGAAKATENQAAEAPVAEVPAAESKVEPAPVAEAPAQAAAPTPAPPVKAPAPAEAPAQSAAAPAPSERQTVESAQVASIPADRPADSASDVYSGPPIEPGPAPELEALARREAAAPAVPVETPAPAAPQTAALPDSAPQAPAAPERAEPEVHETVVIPAPPEAPRDFNQLSERTPQIYGENNADARIVLRAREDSWVQVRDGQDSLLLTRVLRRGDVYRVPNQSGLTLLTGNAGGIEIEVDGVTVPPLGPVGSVRRQIALDPAALMNRQ
jgi:cytoskeletal protein RodZ